MDVLACLVWVTLALASISFARHSAEFTSDYKSLRKRATPSVTRVSCLNNDSATPVNHVNTTDRLRLVRFSMKGKTPTYDAYIVPSSDEHQSEFVADHDQRREFISGFRGSAGTAVVLLDTAALWTDGRYFVQAESELDCNWLLMKRGEPGVPSLDDWIIEKLKPGSTVGADSKLIAYHKWKNLKEKFEKSNITLTADDNNIIDTNWIIPHRPLESVSHIFIHDVKYAGKTWQEKVEEVIAEVNKTGASGLIVTSLEEISWLFNLRGHDVSFVPVFKAYALVSVSFLRLYVKSLKITPEVKKHLCPKNETALDCVQVVEYGNAFEDMKSIVEKSEKILVSSTSSSAVVNLIPEKQRILSEGASPIAKIKLIKNPVEIAGMKNAALKDAVAIIDFIAMLEEEVKFGKHWDEMKAVRTLTKYRQEQELNQGESFATISAFGANAAVIHYKPQLSTNRNINNKHMFLLDSGGQYLDGTTDITRTFHFGEPTEYEVDAYTRVLMGAIDLITVTFPDGVSDVALDILARRPLFSVGLNYPHGTGHGIGHFLNVHEGTIAISNKPINQGYALKPGMFLSDEPGYYADNKFGIRLETMMMVVKTFPKYHSKAIDYYKFEPVSFVPFEPKLIDLHLLSKKQKEWLNSYNIKIRNSVGLELRKQNRKRGFDWLLSKTEHIPVEAWDSRVSSASQLYLNINFISVVTVFVVLYW